jgi:hypothetical protein
MVSAVSHPEFRREDINKMMLYVNNDPVLRIDPQFDHYLKKIVDSLIAGKSFIDTIDDLTKNYTEDVRSSSCLSLLKCLSHYLRNEPPPYSWYDFEYLQGRAGSLASYRDASSGIFYSYNVRDLAEAYCLNTRFSDWIDQNAEEDNDNEEDNSE